MLFSDSHQIDTGCSPSIGREPVWLLTPLSRSTQSSCRILLNWGIQTREGFQWNLLHIVHRGCRSCSPGNCCIMLLQLKGSNLPDRLKTPATVDVWTLDSPKNLALLQCCFQCRWLQMNMEDSEQDMPQLIFETFPFLGLNNQERRICKNISEK